MWPPSEARIVFVCVLGIVTAKEASERQCSPGWMAGCCVSQTLGIDLKREEEEEGPSLHSLSPLRSN